MSQSDSTTATQPREERLYNLLPATYRIRDAEMGQPLRALLAVVQTEVENLENDIGGLYEDWFIETCAEWLVPYIGDLLGVRNLHSGGDSGVYSLRSYVANTLRYRQRKGTAAVLEQLSRDITNYPARAVEYFKLLITTQYMNHVRTANAATPDMRRWHTLELVDTPFDTIAHTLEVRRIAERAGRYNIPNIGLHLWPLQAYAILKGTATELAPADADPNTVCYRFDPRGDLPLFNNPQTESDITHLAEEINVPGRLRRRPLAEELETLRQATVDATALDPADGDKMINEAFRRSLYFGARRAVRVFIGDKREELDPREIVICDLTNWRPPPAAKEYTREADGVTVPVEIMAAVDPVLGRLTFRADNHPGPVEVSYSYGAVGDIGGGPYDQLEWLNDFRPNDDTWVAYVTSSEEKDLENHIYPSLVEALAEWNKQAAAWNLNEGETERSGVIAVMDNRSYPTVDGDNNFVPIVIPGNCRLLISGGPAPTMAVPDALADLQEKVGEFVRPHIVGDLQVQCDQGVEGEHQRLHLNGLLLQSELNVNDGCLTDLELAHCTLFATDGDGTRVTGLALGKQHQKQLSIVLDRCVCGPVMMGKKVAKVKIRDSIIDNGKATADSAVETAEAAGDSITDNGNKKASIAVEAEEAVTEILASTIFGDTSVYLLNASDCIFDDSIKIARRQESCVRYSYVYGDGVVSSYVPQCYRCQPRLAIKEDAGTESEAAIRLRVRPSYISTQYNEPEYALLRTSCAEEIRCGSEEGSEMGAYAFLKQPQREANLRQALDEYLRFGLEAGIFKVIGE